MAETMDETLAEPVVKTYFSPQSFESERYSDFDVFAAIGELVDNSIEANATHIEIQISTKSIKRGQRGRTRVRAETVAVADNGEGMRRELVEDCLIHGESSRYGSREGIGRFGVGLVKGSISQCRRIEVYSRLEGMEWWHSRLDLDEIRDSRSVVVTPAVRAEPPAECQGLVKGQSGTIVIWKKNDLMPAMTEHRLQEIAHWLGRTYRKHIATQVIDEDDDLFARVKKNDEKITIRFQGADVVPYDPLFVVPNADGDAPAELAETIVIPDPSSEQEIVDLAGAFDAEPDDLQFDPYANPIRIRMSLLPMQLREKQGSGGELRDGKDERRRVRDNTGFSILRHGREVYYGPWLGKLDLGSKQKGEQLDRYWGMEIEFSPHFDELFSVKNIKVGAKPIPDLKNIIERVVRPTIDGYRRRIQSDWAQSETAAGTQPEDSAHGPPHDEETSSIGDSIPPPKITATVDQTQKLIQAAKRKGLIETDIGPDALLQLKTFIETLRHSYTILPDEAAGTQNFFDVTPEGGKAILTYYVNHPFFRFRQRLINRLQDDDITKEELVLETANLRRLTDLLLFGFSKGYIEVLKEDPKAGRHLLDVLMFQWSLTLRRFIDDLGERHGSESS